MITKIIVKNKIVFLEQRIKKKLINLVSFKLDKDGYVIFRYKKDSKRKIHKLHRFIMQPKNSKIQIDHINGNKLDNRKINLRFCTSGQNQQNRPKSKKKKTHSIYKGVTWHKRHKKWKATIGASKKYYHLGYFFIEKNAAIAYNEAAKKLHGKFARLNNI